MPENTIIDQTVEVTAVRSIYGDPPIELSVSITSYTKGVFEIGAFIGEKYGDRAVYSDHISREDMTRIRDLINEALESV